MYRILLVCFFWLNSGVALSSEVSGSLILKLPNKTALTVDDASSNLSWGDIKKMLASAGISGNSSELSELKKSKYLHDGIEIRQEFLLIYPIDEEYMPLMRLLVNRGSDIEVYGGIEHEYGIMQYYALTAEATRFVGTLDYEADDPTSSYVEKAKFLQLVPVRVKTLFDDIF